MTRLTHSPTDTLVLWEDSRVRIVQVKDPLFPGFCRVIWRTHCREMTDLNIEEQRYFMNIVFTSEHVLRTLLCPEKINLASLGNQVPHLHWHVIARFAWDSHFPHPIWAQAQRDTPTRQLIDVQQRLIALPAAIRQACSQFS
ncbi:MAG: HIT family protein [Ottowia sp.]|nr:HIT family protein [Ottowia sp.]